MLLTPQESKAKADARHKLKIISRSCWSENRNDRVTTCRWIETKAVVRPPCKMNYGVSHIKACHDSAGGIEFNDTTNVEREVVHSSCSYFKWEWSTRSGLNDIDLLRSKGDVSGSRFSEDSPTLKSLSSLNTCKYIPISSSARATRAVVK